MKLFLINREQIQSVGSFLVSELDSIVARIRGAWNVEHNEDDTHGHVHANSVASGRITFSDISEADLANAQENNYNPPGLSTASLLRLTPTVDSPVLTGLQVPQDEDGTVLDGRVLVIENASPTYALKILAEHTASFPRNRFNLPLSPGEASVFFVNARSLVVVIYNAKLARWVVQSQSNENVVIEATISGSQNDYAPTGFRSAGVLRLTASAASLQVTGFDATAVPAPSRKVVRNDGLYTVTFAHASTSSVAANRIRCPGGVRYILNPRESVELYREVNIEGWKLVASGKAHQFVDVAYNAADYLASAGTWTVDSADLVTLCYRIDGNEMTVSFRILNTDVSAAPTTLTFPIPRGRTAARTIRNICTVVDAGTEDFGRVEVTAGGTTIAISKKAGAAFTTTAADNTSVIGEITFYVQDAAAGISENHTDVAHGDTAHSDVEHSDVAHADVAHGDSHDDTAHTDVSHSDVAHTDTSSHSDVAHDDVAHVDTAHSDVAHVDVAHSDVAHSDVTHDDHTDDITPAPHVDVPHEDQAHSDVAHSDTAHTDVAHSDTAHTDVAHSDSTSHSDVAHSDVAHNDGGHADSHTDTPAHSDAAHVDVAHGDTVHADNVHSDVGYHTDANHSDI
jgi:hypothetical protein